MMIRIATLASALVVMPLAACSPPASQQPPESATPSGPAMPPAAADAASGPRRDQLVGNWTDAAGCTRDPRMALGPSGAAYVEGVGPGTWSLDAQGRVVLSLVEDNGGEPTPASRHVIRTLTITRLDAEELTGTFDDGSTFAGHRCAPN